MGPLGIGLGEEAPCSHCEEPELPSVPNLGLWLLCQSEQHLPTPSSLEGLVLPQRSGPPLAPSTRALWAVPGVEPFGLEATAAARCTGVAVEWWVVHWGQKKGDNLRWNLKGGNVRIGTPADWA